MALHLIEANAIFYEVAKTGTEWVRHALKAVGVDYQILEPHKGISVRHGLPVHFKDKYNFHFASIRHPLTWVESWFRFQCGHWTQFEPGLWHPQRCIERCAGRTYTDFVKNLLKHEPGYVSRMYEWYLGPPGALNVDAILRQETLSQDLDTVLQNRGYKVGTTASVPRQNVSHNHKTDLSADLILTLIQSEQPAIQRWYDED